MDQDADKLRASLKRLIHFRMSATDEKARESLDALIQRVQARLLRLESAMGERDEYGR